LAGLAVGFWKSQEEIATKWAIDKIFEPKANDREALIKGWERAIKATNNW
jgi:glycerol kinase